MKMVKTIRNLTEYTWGFSVGMSTFRYFRHEDPIPFIILALGCLFIVSIYDHTITIKSK